METDPDLIEAPILLAFMGRLEKIDPKEEGPDVLWTITALPGNLTACGATPQEAEQNFHNTLRGLSQRLEADGTQPIEWWRNEYMAMSDAEKATWRREMVFLAPPPTGLRLIKGLGYLRSRKVHRQRSRMSALVA